MTYTFGSVEEDSGLFRALVHMEGGTSVGIPFTTFPTEEEIEQKVADYLYVQELIYSHLQ